MRSRGIYRRLKGLHIHGDALVVLRPCDRVFATLTLECGHVRYWDLDCIDDGGRVFALRKPPPGLWCHECEGM